MQLYAAGFNAWNQLRFLKQVKTAREVDGAVGPEEPDDIASFECVLQDERIANVRPFLTFTAVTTSDSLLVAGAAPDNTATASGEDNYSYCEALNGRVIAQDRDGCIWQYASVDAFAKQSHREDDAADSRIVFGDVSNVVQTVACDAGFAALTADGQVWTWGDSRYPECLGRDVTEASPADRPGRVACLENLPTGQIVKIAAGGYALAALTRGRDLYCWGGFPGRAPVLMGLTGEPAPVVIMLDSGDGGDADADMDVVDVGVGEAHMIVLTARGTVCVIGRNTNGQLGLGAGPAETVSSWAKVSDLPLSSDQRAVGVSAGPRSSFILVAKADR